jgi:hypothetical protein
MLWVSPTPGPQKIVNKRAIIAPKRLEGRDVRKEGKQPYQRYFPGLDAVWPKHRYRLLWSWIFALNRKRVAKLPPWDGPEEWSTGHHLPGIYRGDHRTDIYTRNCIPVTENLSRQIYFKATRPKTWLGRAYETVFFKLYWHWAMYTNFSTQDFRAVNYQRYDTPEHLSTTDIHQIYWRRLVLQARGMMKPEEAEAVPKTAAEKFSYDLEHKEQREG